MKLAYWLTSTATGYDVDVKPVSEHSSSDINHKEAVTDVGRTTTGQGLCKTAQFSTVSAWIVLENDGVTPCDVKLFLSSITLCQYFLK